MRYRLMNYAPAIDRWGIRFNMLTISDLKNQIPDYSKDIKLNLSSLIINSDMDEKLVYGCALASALALDNERYQIFSLKNANHDLIMTILKQLKVLFAL